MGSIWPMMAGRTRANMSHTTTGFCRAASHLSHTAGQTHHELTGSDPPKSVPAKAELPDELRLNMPKANSLIMLPQQALAKVLTVTLFNCPETQIEFTHVEKNGQRQMCDRNPYRG